MDVLVYAPKGSSTLMGLLKMEGLSFEVFSTREPFLRKASATPEARLIVLLDPSNFEEELPGLDEMVRFQDRTILIVPPGKKDVAPQGFTIFERPVSVERIMEFARHASGHGAEGGGYEALLTKLFELEQRMFTGMLRLEMMGHEGAYVFRNGLLVDFLWDGASHPDYALIPIGTVKSGWEELVKDDVGEGQGEPIDILGDSLDSWLELIGQLPPMGAVIDIDERVLVDHLEDIPDMANALLRLVDGRKTLLDLLLSSPYDPLTAARYVAYLYFTGVIYEVDDGTSETEEPISTWLKDPVNAVRQIVRKKRAKRDTDLGMKLPQPRGEVVEAQSGAISSQGQDSATVVGEITVTSPNEGINDSLPSPDFDLYGAETIPPISEDGEYQVEYRETLLGLGQMKLPDLDKQDTIILEDGEDVLAQQPQNAEPQGGDQPPSEEGAASPPEDTGTDAQSTHEAEPFESTEEVTPLVEEGTPLPEPKPFILPGDEYAPVQKRGYGLLITVAVMAAAVVGIGAYFLAHGSEGGSDEFIEEVEVQQGSSSEGAGDVPAPSMRAAVPSSPSPKPEPPQQPMAPEPGAEQAAAPSQAGAASAAVTPKKAIDPILMEEVKLLVRKYQSNTRGSARALLLLEKKRRENPDSAFILGALAYCYIVEAPKKGKRMALEALKKDPASFPAWLALATHYARNPRSKKFKEAAYHFLRNAPKDIANWGWMDPGFFRNYIVKAAKEYEKESGEQRR